MKVGMKLYGKHKSILKKTRATALLCIHYLARILAFLPFAGASLGPLKVFRSTSDLFEEISSIFLFNLRLPVDISSKFLMLLPEEEDFFFSDSLLQLSFDRDL